jgi:hypothetical protein
MKRSTLLIIASIIVSNSFSQEKEIFKPGVLLTENLITDELKNAKSILFVFDVVGCEANFYNDLTEHLEKRFKKSDIKIGFNYDIYTNVEKEKIPKKKFLNQEFDLICYISTSKIKGWDIDLGQKRKQNYDLILTLRKNDSENIIGSAIINVNSYYTIATQNKNLSKLIYELITP